MIGVEKRGCFFMLFVGVFGVVVGGALFNTVSKVKHVIGFNLGSMLVVFVGVGVVCLGLWVLGISCC